MGNAPNYIILAEILVLFFGIGLHEYAHCKFADLAGDPTPRYYGRVTLNLFKHFEASGTIMMVVSSLFGYGLGWGRAAICTPSKMHHPRRDWFISVAAGPMSNVVQATIYAFILRLTMHSGWFFSLTTDETMLFLKSWLVYGVAINLGLCIFNLIPFGPLDGHWLVGLLLPEKQRFYWFKFNNAVGRTGLIVIVLMLQTAHIQLTTGPVRSSFHFLTGQDLYSAFDILYPPIPNGT